jgi:ATP-dependent Lhr-like helicase
MPEKAQNEGSRSDRHLRDALGDVGRAFFDFPSLSDVQLAAIPSIREGENTLVCAATAAGKTEAVIAPLVWRVRRKGGNRSRGTQVLAVAPTRALVADLAVRLESPLAQFGWRCAAQTSDFAGAESSPEVLITTPESLDSMLVRRFRRKNGSVTDHLLSQVSAVFVDEAHCFDSTARGDQLRFLLVRLRKLREFAREKGWCADAAMQICAASATVYQPKDLAARLLGNGAKAIACAGRRPIDILQDVGCWLRVEQDMSASALARHLPRVTSAGAIGKMLWTALQSGECRKALVFVPSRRECDRMGKELRRYLKERRAIWVDSHHGSLSREHRLRAEQGFHEHRDAVLVATNTLEVGVDIGDVDVVALVGAPPDTSSLLQRIGRGGRRTGLTRLLPLARNSIEAAALGSQLANAATGSLEAKHRFRRWDVFPQQVISYIRQNQGQGRTQSSLVNLATQAWDQEDTAKIATAHLQAWCNEGYLIEQRGRVHLGTSWQKFADQEESDYTIHSNIRSSAVGVAVRNDLTGEIIGHVAGLSEGGHTLTIGGRQHRVVRQDADIVVSPVTDESADEAEDTPQYRGRRRRISETFAAHVRRGCGLEATQAPLVKTANRTLWFHFGGEVYETALRELHPTLCERPVIAGIALSVSPRFEAKALQSINKSALESFVASEGLRLLEDEGLGRFAEDLPTIGIETLLADLQISDKFAAWVNTREISPATPIAKLPTLATLLAGD